MAQASWNRPCVLPENRRRSRLPPLLCRSAGQAGCCCWLVFFAVFSVLLSPQPYWSHTSLTLRYHLPLLPLLLIMKGLFIEWLWRRSKPLAAVALATLLFSNLGAWPFNALNQHTGRSLLGAEPFLLAREIHRPYRNAIGVVADYLFAPRGAGRPVVGGARLR